MITKSRHREKTFVPGTSRNRETGVTLRLRMVRDETEMLEMGARIAELRKASGMKQQAIADHCDVELRTYQFWQQGKHPPSGDALQKLAELFKVTPKFILRGQDATAPDLSTRRRQLDRIEDMLADVQDRLVRLEQSPPSRPAEAAQPQTIEELLDAQKAMVRDTQALLARIEQDASKRALESRRAGGRPTAQQKRAG